MTDQVILVKYGEMALKGLNKNSFETVLAKNIKRRLKQIGNFEYWSAQSTMYISPADREADLDGALEALKKVFGIASLCRAYVCEKTFEAICETACEKLSDSLKYAKTFKVTAKRADKKFPMKSPEICMELGGVILDRFEGIEVDVKDPEVTVHVEVRDKAAYIHAENIKGAGGLPVGTSGCGLLLLSGGIDSPVAAYMMAKRGVRLSAIHFISPPYTSERARLKVEQLCEKLTAYCGNISFFCVPFTKLQEAIKDNCDEDYFTIIMRRLMIKIANKIAVNERAKALITGESVGQVASQTMEAINCTDKVADFPVFRPCIGMDKTEIIEISRKIDTFDISVQPYEDCCTVFTPRHPRVHPDLEKVERSEAKFDFTALIDEAVENTELKIFKA